MKTLAESLTSAAAKHPNRRLHVGECQTSFDKRCTLCFSSAIDYPAELKGKQGAVDAFWDSLGTGIRCAPLVPSPDGRRYRTVSKRKAFIIGKRFFLGLIGVDDESARSYPMDVRECVIEPASHAHIYGVIQEQLQRKEQSTLVQEFNYVIVKGDDREAIVIFNMNHFSSSNRREVNALSKSLTFKAKNVTGVYVFVDEERSKYYLSGTPRKGAQSNPKPLTKVYGTEKLLHTVGTTKFLYSPLSFTQTNHGIVPAFIDQARTLLDLRPEDTLFDLYCGYGLFSLTLAPSVQHVTGVELSRSSINDAIDNAKRNKRNNVRFHAADISVETLPRFFQRPAGGRNSGGLKFLIDPPRNGTSEEVIEFLAEQQPQKVLHIFCNAEIIGKELKRWDRAGYRAVMAVPFDMFPGTAEMEFMVLLEPKP
ncbi:MAG: class I SAM-dependent RNA methyltransferase [Bacteroidetes bacterium]|nr:class I SAM-dependent RNA methyltransferase [Bacteroidota bacterium]